jgi:cytochrome c biogenesis protein CcmG/thiol:disulfide interchange protein DsbE
VVVGLVVAVLVVILATREPSGERLASIDLVGEQAPSIAGDVVLGEPFDLGATDRWTVVNFFATWCVPCIQEHPELKAFDEEHADLGDARVVSVVYDDQPGDVERFFEENGGEWTVLDSDEGRTALDWGVAKVPESYLVAPSGQIVQRFIGGVTRVGLNDAMAALGGASEPGAPEPTGDPDAEVTTPGGTGVVTTPDGVTVPEDVTTTSGGDAHEGGR